MVCNGFFFVLKYNNGDRIIKFMNELQNVIRCTYF